MIRSLLATLCAAIVLTSCAGVNSTPSMALPQAPRSKLSPRPAYIKHVVLLIQENRSFNDFFATFPGADGTTTGRMKTPRGGKIVKLHQADLIEPCDFGHGYKGFLEDYDGGKMDGFNLEGGGKQCHGYAGTRPYQYVKPGRIAPYWQIAKTYVLAEHMFQTQGSNSYTAHQDLIRGASTIDKKATESLVDSPTGFPWGCDAPKGTATAVLLWIGSSIKYEGNAGPFPCTNHFPSSGKYYRTLRDLLDLRSISWKYYTPGVSPGVGGYWDAFDTIAAVRYGPEWGTNVTDKAPFEKQIFRDIRHHQLPAVSWVIPDDENSDHPGPANDKGPSWVASVVNAIGESPYWRTTAIIIVWDDWGGFYDNAPPPFFDHWGGVGFRVPMLLVAPYARKGGGSNGGYISTTQYEFGSILRFIENNWSLGSLGTTDARAKSIVDCFDFSQPPRAFVKIDSKYSQAYFERQPPSGRPNDSE